MFYKGNLQSGIKAAIEQSKLVACFVRDDEDESAIWENDFLKDLTLTSLLLEKSILLRMQAGSEEAGFLAAIYPLPKTPTLLVTRSNGQLREYLTAGVSKADFLKRLKSALNDESETRSPGAADGVLQSSAEEGHPQLESTTRGTTDLQTIDSRTVREQLAERSARMEIMKKEKDAAEKADRAARSAAQRKSANEAALSDPQKAASMKYAIMQKRRQQEARNERERILKRVEDDKAERKAREALRKEQTMALKKTIDLKESNASEAAFSNLKHLPKEGDTDCAIQVRLFDGSTIRSRFSSQATLRNEVRQWIDQQQDDGDTPYSFKEILTPRPSRVVTISEEDESLYSQGLTPNATLVLVPIMDYTSAYETSSTNFISRGLSSGFGIVTSGVSMVVGTLGGFLGESSASASQPEPRDGSPGLASLPINFSTFESQEGVSDEHQLYNGNALNFEPRRDNVDKED